MKTPVSFLALLLTLSVFCAEAEARGDGRRGGGGGGGGGKSASFNRGGGGGGGGGSARRSPMTGSKIERPAARPAPKPTSRPASKPAARPETRPASQPAQRPSVERPTTRPAPDRRPGGGDDIRPGGNRPETKPAPRPGGIDGDNRPGAGAGNGNRPGNGAGGRPETKPAPRPGGNDGDNRPGGGNANRPGNGNDNRPGGGNANRPGDDNRPGGGNANRPGNDNRPGGGNANRPGNDYRPGEGNSNRPGNGTRPGPRPDHPGANRPSTLPGMVTYPNRPGNNNNRPGNNNNRPGNNNRPNWGNGNGNNINGGNTYITNVNKNRKNTHLNRPATLPADRRNWDSNRWGGNRGVWGNNNNVNINVSNNFRYNNNYSYRPNYWGARPWWGASTCHTWHHGHWNYGYNSHYYNRYSYYHNDSNFASGFMWGIAVWSLGNMVYDMGYQSYRNPYQAPPVQSYSSKTTINYTQPVSVTAAANPPGDEAATELAETKSAEATVSSRAAFKSGDYVSALKSADEAIAYAPGDVTLHEYRALVLFALGRYSDAAGVLNPVLASGPGWGWDTMVGFYDSAVTYTSQLRKLEGYVRGRMDAADGHFLLGYHYLVCGYMDKAYDQFETTTKLQPADSISRQLRDLTKSSLPDAGSDEPPAAEPPASLPPPVPGEKLVGTWVSDRGADGKVTFKMEESGDYTWSYINGADTKELKGTYGLDDKDLLVMTSDDSQMVSSVTLEGDGKMKFVLVGAPEGDPGLDFTKG